MSVAALAGGPSLDWMTTWPNPPSSLEVALLLSLLVGAGCLFVLPAYGSLLLQWLSGQTWIKSDRPGPSQTADGDRPDDAPRAGEILVEAADEQRELDLPLMAPGPAAEVYGHAETRCRMDLAATGEGLELILELPGIEENDLDIRVTDGAITISGEVKRPCGWKDKHFRVVERDYGAFSRSLELPEGVRTDRIKAVLNRGLLKVTIPNPTKPEPKTIVVQAEPIHLNPTLEGLEWAVDLPGLEAEDVEVMISGDLLVVRGRRRVGPNADGEASEVGESGFSRVIELPEGANVEQISAVLGMGVLTVAIPVPIKLESKKIEVRSAA